VPIRKPPDEPVFRGFLLSESPTSSPYELCLSLVKKSPESLLVIIISDDPIDKTDLQGLGRDMNIALVGFP
ncbi:MAG TPA: hypothetical protein PLU95_05555, partial [Syntrophales bacterium]|nr:hypothetical protein [Syntrophales bacterium]